MASSRVDMTDIMSWSLAAEKSHHLGRPLDPWMGSLCGRARAETL
jgi:hypothetical protein